MLAPEGYVTVPEYCRNTGYTDYNVTKWIKAGKLPAIRVGKHYFVPETEMAGDHVQLPNCRRRLCRFSLAGKCTVLTENMNNEEGTGCPFYKGYGRTK